ncbi:MAG: metal ABC transporter permease, partial [Caldilineaceae bacterium]|nr:metal ABC transporter permease [Caldilineaceae bacterium]
LFGDVLAVSSQELWLTLGLGSLILLTVMLFYKELLVISFDPVLAAVLRLPERFLRYLLLILIAVTIVVALQTVGIALVLAMLVTPAATAQLLTRRLPTMMLTAAILGAVANVAGLYVSYYVNIAAGPAMVLMATAFFLVVFFFAPQRGLLSRRLTAMSNVVTQKTQ